MSRARYTPVTADLLVRKGQARPWAMPGADGFDFSQPAEISATPALEPEDEARIAAEYAKWMRERDIPPSRTNGHAQRTHVQGDGDIRRYTIRLTQSEFERIGIIAVKREMTRQQVLRDAVERYLAAAQQEYKAKCTCLGGVCNGAC